MGEEAARLAIRLADELDHEHGATDAAGATGSAPTPRMDLATSLVVRESTAPPAGVAARSPRPGQARRMRALSAFSAPARARG
jgi:hypothetical protein